MRIPVKAKPIQIDALKSQIKTNYKAVLLFGTDFSVVEDCAQQIIKIIISKPDDFSVIKVSKSQIKETPTILTDEANTISFLTERKLIWLKEADNTHTNTVESFIDNLKTNSFLLLTADNLLKNSSLRLLCENNPHILTIACYEDSEKDIRFLIQNTLKSNNCTFSQNIIDLLYNRLNENRLTTKNELEKLVIYLGKNKDITVQDVEAIIPDITDTTTDILCFSVSGGNQEDADKSIQILLSNGENPVSIVRILSSHFNKLLIGADLLSKNESSDSICKKILRANQYMLKDKIISHIYMWKKEYIIKTIELLTETEIQTKTTGVPPDIVLERTITMITGLARKLKRQQL